MVVLSGSLELRNGADAVSDVARKSREQKWQN
jgi:hypothetical protein